MILTIKLFAVGLIFGVSLLSDVTEGVKCHKCEGLACKKKAPPPPDVDCASGYCVTINEGLGAKKDCAASAKEGACIIKHKESCVTLTNSTKPEMESCIGTDAKTPAVDEDEICVCNEDHCNSDSVEDTKKTTSGPEPVSEAPKGKCYSCYDPKCSGDVESLEKADCPHKYCELTILSSKVISRGCFFKPEIAEKCYKGGKCLTSEKNAECTGSPPPQNKLDTKICICEGELCNTNFGEGLNSNFVYFLVIMGVSVTAKLI